MYTPEQPRDMSEQDSNTIEQALESSGSKIDSTQRMVIERALYVDELRQEAAYLSSYLETHKMSIDPELYHLLLQKKELLSEGAELNEVFNRNDRIVTEDSMPLEDDYDDTGNDELLNDVEQQLRDNNSKLRAVNENLMRQFPVEAKAFQEAVRELSNNIN